MADSTEIKTMIDSEASKTQGAPVERRKNASGNGRRKLTPHPSNPSTSPNNMQVRIVFAPRGTLGLTPPFQKIIF